MNPRYPWYLLALLWAGSALAVSAAPLRVLYFTKSSGFEHSVIRQDNGGQSYSEKVLKKLEAGNDITFTFSKDGSLFTPE
ncbi:MAG TPA: ThuA domain-containing protein, partial [Lacunisphaera sp.]|nr:ThuA domain-containing protein [Lacunisphaera sp.]